MSQVQFNLPPEFKWEATDSDGDVNYFTHEPSKYDDYWSSDDGEWIKIVGVLGKCENWEDSLVNIEDRGVIEIGNTEEK